VTIQEAKQYLEEVSASGSVYGIETMQQLLCELSRPQDGMKFIHVAGTNGKGSTVAYLSTILSQAGYRTGRYTSPAVFSRWECMQVDGEWILEETFARLLSQVRVAISRMVAKGYSHPTVFEIETAVALLFFKEQACTFVVWETGLGGTFDATNAIEDTLVCVFSGISIDHTKLLGETIEEITAHKLGILKEGCHVVTAIRNPVVLRLMKEAVQEKRATLHVELPEEISDIEQDWSQQRFSYGDWTNLRTSLLGSHQRRNSITALGVVKVLRKCGYPITDEAVYRGLKKTVWAGRMTCISTNPMFFVDGAHNEDAVYHLRKTMQELFPNQKFILIFGVFQDKEYEKMVQLLAPLAKWVYTVPLPDKKRGMSPEDLKEVVMPYCSRVEAMEDVESAVRSAYHHATKQDVILAFGSLSYLGEVMGWMQEKGGARWITTK
jgi:dihydrofolate synthase/folylpolyglutamate synthase